MTNFIRTLPRRALRNAVFALSDALSPAPKPLTAKDEANIARLRSEIATAALPETVPGGAEEWMENLVTLRHHVLNEDPREFLRWPVILKAMFVTFYGYVARELLYLLRHNWRRWRPAIAEAPVGRPYRYPLYPASSGNLIHHAYHLALFERSTATEVADLGCIVEFGGGYGSMCRLTRNLGFRGTYIIFDLPHFSALQRFYLRSMGFAVADAAESATPGEIVCLSDANELRNAVARASANGKALMIGTWSLSEAPIAARNILLELADRFALFLIAFQSDFAGVDNVRFFADWTKRHPAVRWQFQPIRHFPSSKYLFGKRS
ncbi:MAG: hypothetical protein PSV22_11475 [Pseudolabrys sp.]|nr:hypothetical protein [Pseudolabrys sp.]